MTDWLLLGLGMLLIVGTGLFVASEFALVNLDRSDLEARQARGERGLGPPIAALKRTSTHLSSAQLGITLTTLLTGYTMEPALSRLLAPVFAQIGLRADLARPLATVIGISVATLLSMIIGELIPKNLAIALPRLTARLVSPFQIAFTTIFLPVVRLLNGFSNAVVRSLGIEPKEELSSARTVDELSSLVQHSAKGGSLDQQAATLLTKTLEFADYTASDAMTPRTRMDLLGAGATAKDVVALARATGHSRFPLAGDGVDDIVGVVHVKRALAVPHERREEVAALDLAQSPQLVPGTLPLDELLGLLRSGGQQIAVVLDEYGGTAGVVTLEDLVEELVGEVADEHDRFEPSVVRAPDGSWTLPGVLRLDEVEERVGLQVPEDENYDTIGGFVMDALERVPQPGDEVEVPGGVLFVTRMDGLRVDSLRFEPVQPPSEPSSAPHQPQSSEAQSSEAQDQGAAGTEAWPQAASADPAAQEDAAGE